MRWKLEIGGLVLLLAIAAGCKQQCFLTKDCYDHYQTAMPELLTIDTKVGCQPVVPPVGQPPTPLDPDREIRYMSLAEATAISLEQGNIGNSSLIGAVTPGGGIGGGSTAFNEQQLAFSPGTGGRVNGQQSIRVLRLDPAIIGAGIEASLSKFDAVWTSSLSWQNTDRPVATATDVFQTGGTAATTIQTMDATLSTAILKPLPAGGVAGITFNVPYEFTTLPAAVNPSYRPQLQFQFEQPLLQGFGVEINQILGAAHPGSILNSGVLNSAPTAEGILITRIRFDQERTEFERNVQIMVANVEIAYWNLFSSYWTLFAAEAGLRQSFEAYKINKARYDAGRVSIADLAQARGQYEGFRTQRLSALNNVLDKERSLRGMLALPVEDGFRLVPSDSPTVAPYQPDWDSALKECLALRPDLVLARQEIKAAQLNLIAQKDALLPDLRFTATYDINALGDRLDGADTNNALRNLASDHFNDWSLGLRLNVPIGFRNAHANVRIAELQLARAYQTLYNGERDAVSFLSQQYRNVLFSYELIRANRATREAFADQLRARFQEFLAGRGTLDVLLEAQRFWSAALDSEYQSIRDYNIAIVSFEFAKGTVLQRNSVVIGEGALPQCAQVRAVEHLKARSDALKVLERPKPSELPVATCDQCGHDEHGAVMMPPLPQTPDGTTSIPDMFRTSPPLKDAPLLPPVPTDRAAAPFEGKPLPPLPPANVTQPMPPASTTSLPTTPVPTTGAPMMLPPAPGAAPATPPRTLPAARIPAEVNLGTSTQQPPPGGMPEVPPPPPPYLPGSR